MNYRKVLIGGMVMILAAIFILQKDGINILKGQFFPEDEYQDNRPECVKSGACPGGGDGLLMNEGDAVKISCPGDQVILITEAIYGTNCPGYDEYVDSQNKPFNPLDPEIDLYFGNQYQCGGACGECSGQQSCVFNMDNNQCGDTCYGTQKKGTLSYTCVDREELVEQEGGICLQQAPPKGECNNLAYPPTPCPTGKWCNSGTCEECTGTWCNICNYKDTTCGEGYRCEQIGCYEGGTVDGGPNGACINDRYRCKETNLDCGEVCTETADCKDGLRCISTESSGYGRCDASFCPDIDYPTSDPNNPTGPGGSDPSGGGGMGVGGGSGDGGGSGSGGSGSGGDNGDPEEPEEEEENEPVECPEGTTKIYQSVCVPNGCEQCQGERDECLSSCTDSCDNDFTCVNLCRIQGDACNESFDNCCNAGDFDASDLNCDLPPLELCVSTTDTGGGEGGTTGGNTGGTTGDPPGSSSAPAPSSASSSQPSGCQSDSQCVVSDPECNGYCQGDGSCIAVCPPTTPDCREVDCSTAYCGTDGCGGCCPTGSSASSRPTSSRPSSVSNSSRPTSSTPSSFSNSSRPTSSTPSSVSHSSTPSSTPNGGYCCINNFCANCAGGDPLDQCMASCGLDDSSSSASTTHSPKASSTPSTPSGGSSQSSGFSPQSSSFSQFSLTSTASSKKTVASVSSVFSAHSSYTSYGSASSVHSTLHAPVCGDGTVNQSFEQCDDGNVLNYDGCNSSCQKEQKYAYSSTSSRIISYNPPGTPDPSPPVCGDFRLQYGEQCDDGNTANGDGCGWNCRLEPGTGPRCGDGIVTVGEQCDDGNTNNFDDCSVQCIFQPKEPPIVAAASICGNGILAEDEECDDSNRRDGDGCSASCLLEIGICGDGIVQVLLGEQCEQSTHSADLPYRCEECRFISLFCGDGNVDDGEECDDADQNSTEPDAHCRPDCSIARCGDAIVDSAELCDDGNRKNGDGCDTYCRVEEGVPGVTVIAAEQNIPFPQTPFVPIQLPLAQLQPLIQGQAPVGDTGPAAVAIIAAGAGSGVAWVRKKRRRK